MLVQAARYDHVVRVIAPALAAGDWVLCDRFSDSTRVYQGIAGGLGLELIDRLHHTIFGDLWPDLTLILDVPVPVGLARRRGGPRAASSTKALDYHERVREGFLAIARAEPARCVVVDGTQPADAVGADRAGGRGGALRARARGRALRPTDGGPARAARAARPRRAGPARADVLARAARSGRLPHGWLLSGPQGVGKATLAYRFARALLAGPAACPGSLALSPEHPVFRQVAQGAHPDLTTSSPSATRAPGACAPRSRSPRCAPRPQRCTRPPRWAAGAWWWSTAPSGSTAAPPTACSRRSRSRRPPPC